MQKGKNQVTIPVGQGKLMLPHVMLWNLFVRRAIAESAGLLWQTHSMPDWFKRKISMLGADNHHRMEVEDAFTLVVERYLILALKEKGLRFDRTETLDGMPIRNMRVQSHHFVGPSGEDIRCHSLVTDPLTVHPMECLVSAVLTAGAGQGCRNCRFTASGCSYCLDGRLRQMLVATGKFQPFDEFGWPVLKAALGEPYAACLEDLGRHELYRLRLEKADLLKELRKARLEERKAISGNKECPWRKLHLRTQRELKKAIQALGKPDKGEEDGDSSPDEPADL